MTGQKHDVLVKPVLSVPAGHSTDMTCFTSRVRHQNNVAMDVYNLKTNKGQTPVFILLPEPFLSISTVLDNP